MSRRTEGRWRELPPVRDAIGSPAPTDSPFSLEMMHRRRGGDRILHPCTFVVIFTPRPGKYASDQRSKHDMRMRVSLPINRRHDGRGGTTIANGRVPGTRQAGRRARNDEGRRRSLARPFDPVLSIRCFVVSPVRCRRNPAQPKKPTPKKASVVGCTDTLLLRLSSSHRDILLLVSRPTTRPRPLA